MSRPGASTTIFILRQVASASIVAANTVGGILGTVSRVRNQIASNTRVNKMVSLCALTQASKSSNGFQANANVARKRAVDEMVPYFCCRCPLIDQISNVDTRCEANPRTRRSMTIVRRYEAPPKSPVSHCREQRMIAKVGPYAEG